MKNNIKMISCALAGIMVGGISVVCANQAIQAMQNTEIKILVNGQEQVFKDETTGETQYPITYNNRTYLPLRNIAELTGWDIDYNNISNAAFLYPNASDLRVFHPEADYNGVWFKISPDGKSLEYNLYDKSGMLNTIIDKDIRVKKIVMFNNYSVDSILRFVILTEDGEVYYSNEIDIKPETKQINFYYMFDNIKDIDIEFVGENRNLLKVLKDNSFEYVRDFDYDGLIEEKDLVL